MGLRTTRECGVGRTACPFGLESFRTNENRRRSARRERGMDGDRGLAQRPVVRPSHATMVGWARLGATANSLVLWRCEATHADTTSRAWKSWFARRAVARGVAHVVRTWRSSFAPVRFDMGNTRSGCRRPSRRTQKAHHAWHALMLRARIGSKRWDPHRTSKGLGDDKRGEPCVPATSVVPHNNRIVWGAWASGPCPGAPGFARAGGPCSQPRYVAVILSHYTRYHNRHRQLTISHFLKMTYRKTAMRIHLA